MLITSMSSKLDKLDQVDHLVSSVEVMRSTVERLENVIMPREVIEERLRSIEGGR